MPGVVSIEMDVGVISVQRVESRKWGREMSSISDVFKSSPIHGWEQRVIYSFRE